jgi:hypothetical protein
MPNMPAKKTTQSAEAKVTARPAKSVKTPAKTPAKVATKATAKTKSAAPAVSKPKKTATKAKSVVVKVAAPEPVVENPVISREEIELRAYFISERRQTMGWPGNSSTDWMEAEAQLIAEARRRLKKSL